MFLNIRRLCDKIIMEIIVSMERIEKYKQMYKNSKNPKLIVERAIERERYYKGKKRITMVVRTEPITISFN